jgi:2-polyprenyl-6-methoxyphenol hydroxylase-like FAD-dependent oxidoreductase
MMLGLLLARAGIEVAVLEKHKDFFRDFRGDTIHPSTLQLMHELGWLDDLLAQPHQQINVLSVMFGDKSYPLPDFTHLPTAAKFIALMPQWDFLNFLAAKAAQFPAFHIFMEHEVTGLLYAGTQVVGVQASTPNGRVEIHAPLTVGCDGRHATTVAAAHFDVIERGVPIDVLWFRLSRRPNDPQNALGYFNHGHAAVLIDRNEYFQMAFLIRKSDFPAIQAAGLEAFKQGLAELVPFLAVPDELGHTRIDEITSFDICKLLTVQINHLHKWHAHGLLCIGDAAHAMSPVGGIGINIAIQDAVAAANILAKPLSLATPTRPVPRATLALVQSHREFAVRFTQFFQAQAHKVLIGVLENPEPIQAPALVRLASGTPFIRRFLGRAIGMGVLPEHIHTPSVTP